MNVNLDPVSPRPEAAAGDAPGGESARSPQRETQTADILPYVAPMFAYVALGGIEGYLPQVESQPSPTWYPIAYAVRVVIVAALAWRYRETWNDLRPAPGPLGIAPGCRERPTRGAPLGRPRWPLSRAPVSGSARLLRPNDGCPTPGDWASTRSG